MRQILFPVRQQDQLCSDGILTTDDFTSLRIARSIFICWQKSAQLHHFSVTNQIHVHQVNVFHFVINVFIIITLTPYQPPSHHYNWHLPNYLHIIIYPEVKSKPLVKYILFALIFLELCSKHSLYILNIVLKDTHLDF